MTVTFYLFQARAVHEFAEQIGKKLAKAEELGNDHDKTTIDLHTEGN